MKKMQWHLKSFSRSIVAPLNAYSLGKRRHTDSRIATRYRHANALRVMRRDRDRRDEKSQETGMRFTKRGMCGVTLALAAGGASAADSSVTLYGVADSYVQYLDNGGNHAVSVKSGGSTGSLFGLMGKEDLGGGLSAEFDVESGFNLNNGSLYVDPSVLFYRQSWVGLKDEKYGELTFGRQYEPTYRIIYPTDPFSLNQDLSIRTAATLSADRATLSNQFETGRANNSILYTSPRLGGVQVYGMYAFASTSAAPVPETIGNQLSVGANYVGYGLYAGVAYSNQHPGTATYTFPSIATPVQLALLDTKRYVGALSYHIGIVNLQFNYAYSQAGDAAAHSTAALLGTAHSFSMIELGATILATVADTIEIAAVERNVRGAHDNALGIQAGIDHYLSKRTSLYARAGYIKNNGTSTESWPLVSVSQTGTNQVMAAVGITHRF
jgi:general bacterial porin, GBP family